MFAHQYGRTVCWTNVLCLYFGGTTPDELLFVGWWYYDAAMVVGVSLSTSDGIAIGSLLSDHLDSITYVPESACYSGVSGSTADGMEVALHSVGEPFFTYDTNGAFIKRNPPPEDIVVRSLSAGDLVSDLDGDC